MNDIYFRGEHFPSLKELHAKHAKAGENQNARLNFKMRGVSADNQRVIYVPGSAYSGEQSSELNPHFTPHA